MNDCDEDAEALKRLNLRMEKSNVVPPDPLEVAPAALYLTAILECVSCLLACISVSQEITTLYRAICE